MIGDSRVINLLVLPVLILFISGYATSASVGAVPSSVNFGSVDRGETVTKTFYIQTSNVNENFTIDPITYPDSTQQMFASTVPYRFEITQQPFEGWVTLQETRIDPASQSTIELSNGGSALVNGNFSFTLNVPSDPEQAQPGVRRGVISLNPNLSAGGGGAGARLIGTTKIQYRFEIPGNVERMITVQDARAFRQGESSAAVEVLLRNAGTVTTTTRDFAVDILDSRGEKVGSVESTGVTLEPGESKWVEASWIQGDKIPEGTYQIDGSINYLTGSATASGSFSLPGFDVVEVVPSDDGGEDGQEEGGGGLPVWLVVMVLVLLTVLMWGFDIEPFWIIAIVGVLSISAFILMSGLPNFLLAVLLIMVGIIIYGGM